MSFFWLIFSYLLGSIPFGYLISRFSGKDILQIGWKKTSGSNVFKNVGKWQGIATGLLDVGKGYLAVYGAQKLGLSAEIQIFSGVVAVVGHNWPVFLKFAGGRGIGTFIGAFLAFSSQILLFSIIPLLVLALVWNAAIGTLLFLLAAIFFSWHFNQFNITGYFTILSLIPILIKRLSPIKEIKNSRDKFKLIRNRLIFDNNETLWDLRIKRIIKPLAPPFLFAPKVGWKAAKYGVKAARKGVKYLMNNGEKVVTEIKVEDFKKMMIAASKKVVLHQEEINRINVFPVADKDTGYNLAATLLGVEGTISRKNYSNLRLRELARDIKEAAMTNARGNVGMICTGYFIEVLDRIKHRRSIDAYRLVLAMKKGIKAAKDSIAEPVEGTILDVIKAAGETAYNTVKIKKEKNIIKVLEEAYKVSEVALKETKEKLQVLKDNDVVDAGALGFLKILEAWIGELKGVEVVSKIEAAPSFILNETREELKFRYEIVFSFKKNEKTEISKIKEELSPLGDSLEIIEANDIIKIHIHTNQPEEIKQRFVIFPEAQFRTEDMTERQNQTRAIKKKPLGLVVDEVADLPKEILEKYHLEEVPFTTTSAPTFKDFLSIYQKALKKFKKILVITVSSKFSGNYSSARIARSIFKKPTKLNIYVFDCNTAEMAEGLIAVRAGELISQGKTTEEIVEYLKVFCPKVILVACLSDFRYVAQGGRFKLPKLLVPLFSFVQKIGIRFLFGLKNGKVKFFGAALGRDAAEILSEEIDKQRKGQKIRVAIAHAENKEVAENLKSNLEKKPGIEVFFVSSVSPAVGTHVGPGAILAAFHPVG